MGASPDVSTTLAGLELSAPVLAASGTFGSGREAAELVDLSTLGGVIVKSMTLAPWKGKATPRMCETPSGMLNAIGIQNKGVDHFIAEELPWLRKQDVTVIASIAGNTVEEFVQVAGKLRTGGRGVAAIEINISCPNLEDRDNMFAHATGPAAAVVAGVRKSIPKLPLFPKLSPNVTSIAEIAGAVLEAGADGLSLINTVFGMSIDVETRRPQLAGGVGGLSGPAIRPIAVRAVHEVHTAFPEVPIIGQGGVASADDALEMLVAGASAIAVGTANFVNPRSIPEIIEGLRAYMRARGIDSLQDIIGSLKHHD